MCGQAYLLFCLYSSTVQMRQEQEWHGGTREDLGPNGTHSKDGCNSVALTCSAI